MNKKQRKQRLWKAKFRKEYQQRILDAVEMTFGVPAHCLCVYVATMAEKISGGKLSSQFGILVTHDKKNAPPLLTAHCWNTLDGQIFDLSPHADSLHRIEYLTEADGEKFNFYKEDTIMFGEADEQDLEADLSLLMIAFHSQQTSGVQ